MSEHDDGFTQRVRERAYDLWEKEGRPEGRHEEFWERARQLEAGWSAAETPSDTEPAGPEDAGIADSFPASDPPANTGITGPGAANSSTAKSSAAPAA